VETFKGAAAMKVRGQSMEPIERGSFSYPHLSFKGALLLAPQNDLGFPPSGSNITGVYSTPIEPRS